MKTSLLALVVIFSCKKKIVNINSMVVKLFLY